jgi:hypothetical protein
MRRADEERRTEQPERDLDPELADGAALVMVVMPQNLRYLIFRHQVVVR